MFSRPRAPRAFHSWWVRRSTPASLAAVSGTITARKTTRSRHQPSKTAKCSSGHNYGKEKYKTPLPIIENRQMLGEVAGRHGVDLRTAALQFSATPDIALALIVGAASDQQIVADYSSMQFKIPAEFWAELKERKLIEQDAPVPA